MNVKTMDIVPPASRRVAPAVRPIPPRRVMVTSNKVSRTQRRFFDVEYAAILWGAGAAIGLTLCSLVGSLGVLVAGLGAVALLLWRVRAKRMFALVLLAVAILVALVLGGQGTPALTMADITYVYLGAAALALGFQSRQSSVTRFHQR